ncbi:MAG: hypothetical protein ACXWJM_04990 [Ramlibacter sp.]
MLETLLRRACGGIVVSLLVACGGGSGGAAPAQPDTQAPDLPAISRVQIASDANDFMGGGRSYDYTKASADISVYTSGASLWVNVVAYERWRGRLVLPAGAMPLHVGHYELVSDPNLVDTTIWAPAPPDGHSGWAPGRWCATGTAGSVDVTGVSLAADGSVSSLTMQADLHCVGSNAGLHVQVQWRADEPLHIPGPTVPPPAGLWTPAPGATPAAGNYLYLESQPGDPVGAGLTRTLTSSSAQPLYVNLPANGHLLTLSQYEAGELREGQFQAMSSIPQMQAGYYGELQGTSASWGVTPVLGAMYWRGPGECTSADELANPYRGWFVVDNISYVNGALQAIDLRFEQHCEGASALLHGKLHWTAN